MDKLLMRPTEVAEILGLGRSKTYQLILEGSIPSIRFGKSVRVPVEALQEWVNNQKQNSLGTSVNAPKGEEK